MPKGRVYTTKNWTCVNLVDEPKNVIRYRNDKPNENTLLKFAITKVDGETKAVLVTKCHRKGGGGIRGLLVILKHHLTRQNPKLR